MASRGTRITVAVAAVVLVGGLVALAAPAVVAATEALATISTGTADFFSTPEPVEETTAADAEDVAATTPDGIPEGYVFVGEGTWIPAGGPGDCTSAAHIHVSKPDDGEWTAWLSGDLVDTGPREFAVGEVGYADDGRIATYTVAPGDSPWAIGDRFCIFNGLTVTVLNGYPGGDAIQPGDVLVLDPEAVPGFELVYPYAD